MPDIKEAMEYIENLMLHHKTLDEAVDHAWHRYGIERETLIEAFLDAQEK